MHHHQMNSQYHARSSARTRAITGFDGQTHYRSVMVAASSAMAILLAAATVLVATF